MAISALCEARVGGIALGYMGEPTSVDESGIAVWLASVEEIEAAITLGPAKEKDAAGA